MRVDLRENGPVVEVALSSDAGIALKQTNFLDVNPIAGTPLWSLRPLSKVGAVAVGGVEVHVHPKVPIDRVLFLLEHGLRRVRWQGEPVDVEHATDLLTAMAEVFERTCRQALRRGLLQGYRVVDEALPLVRGRIREADQLRRRFGLPVPVEVRYDDFTVDTAENRWLRAATRCCLRLPGLSPNLRSRLTRQDLLLADVTPIRRAGLEPWQPSRLNARLQPALQLAEVIVRGSSFEPRGFGLDVTGFIVDMAGVFEDFVCATLGERLRAHSGTTATQDIWHLDVARDVRMKPDLVWYSEDGRPAAVVDAKYKAEKPDGFPDADLYQMLAYCTALQLPVGHLVYAKGNEAGRDHHIAGADVRLRAHVLDLSDPPAHLLASVVLLAREIVVAGRVDRVPRRLA